MLLHEVYRTLHRLRRTWQLAGGVVLFKQQEQQLLELELLSDMLELIPAIMMRKQLFRQPDHSGEGVDNQLFCPGSSSST